MTTTAALVLALAGGTPAAVLLVMLRQTRRDLRAAHAAASTEKQGADARDVELRYLLETRLPALRSLLAGNLVAVPGPQNPRLAHSDFAQYLDAILNGFDSVVREVRHQAQTDLGARMQAATAQAQEQVQQAWQAAQAEYAVRLDQEVDNARKTLREQEAEPERAQAAALVFISRRLHALVHRTLKALSDVESTVEDPDLLRALFLIDHLVTRTRREVENLAMLGGATPRVVRKPLLLATALRSAITETEDYGRIRIPEPPVSVYLQGHVVPAVIHLVAELAENAAKFSPRNKVVLVRAFAVAQGVVIEVVDRGELPMSPEKLHAVNALLHSVQAADVREQLQLGTIGLLVAGRLANRHNLQVQLRPNQFGGTEALVFIPNAHLIPAEAVPVSRPVLRQLEPQPSPAAAGGEQIPVASPPSNAEPSLDRARPSELPQRRSARRLAAAGPQADGLVEAADARPELPRRAPHPAVPAMAPSATDTTGLASRPPTVPNAGLMGGFSAGVQRAAAASVPPSTDTREPS